jgi:hypothetical protein
VVKSGSYFGPNPKPLLAEKAAFLPKTCSFGRSPSEYNKEGVEVFQKMGDNCHAFDGFYVGGGVGWRFVAIGSRRRGLPGMQQVGRRRGVVRAGLQFAARLYVGARLLRKHAPLLQ